MPPHARRGKRRLDARMPRADHDDIIVCTAAHEYTFPYFYNINLILFVLCLLPDAELAENTVNEIRVRRLAEDLAAAIGAELACSRPLAEGADWMSADRYIGVSGQSVAPDLYIAVGISGQIQHTVGMVDSKVVVAVNNDDKAPIFEGADYGIVADLYEALPAIVEAAK